MPRDPKSPIILLLLLLLPLVSMTQPENVQELKRELQRQERILLDIQHEIQLQLQSLYARQHQLDGNDHGGYEYPSYCANCLGDMMEPPASKNLLSGEYSRVTDGAGGTDRSSEGELTQLSDHKRLEAIKQQILLKLNMREKPNVTQSVPKQFVLDTLHRTGEMFVQDPIVERLQQLKRNGSDHGMDGDDDKDYVEDEAFVDDFYARTNEVIMFAERGESIFLLFYLSGLAGYMLGS